MVGDGGDCGPDGATRAAFDRARRDLKAPRPRNPGLHYEADDLLPMTAGDGLLQWRDGTSKGTAPAPIRPPDITEAQLRDRHLWAIREIDVVHACEGCDFGRTLRLGMIKHTNLTGGEPAYSAGELLLLGDDTVVVNGRSGRYGPRSPQEMELVARAFRQSGYRVWSMGYDAEAGMALPFIGVRPT